MTSFKDYVNVQNSLRRLSYQSFLDISEDNVWIQLELSLLFDGRFYGAEMIEEEENNGLYWYILLERGRG